MTHKSISVDTIRWHSVLPWLHLLKAAQLALRMRVLLLALLTVVTFTAGRVAINSLPIVRSNGFGSNVLVPDLRRDSVVGNEAVRFQPMPASVPSERLVIWSGWPKTPSLEWLAWPLETVHSPLRELFQTNSSWEQLASAWTRLLWALLAWGTFGGALARMNAVRFARDESVPIGTAISFSIRLWHSHLYGPLLPLLGVGLLSLGIRCVGLLEQLLGNPGWVVASLGWIPLVLGLLMAALLIVTSISWPLMVVAVSVEGSDGFDGLSRAFGYVMNRPWYLLWLVAVACGVGWLMTFFVWWFFDIAAWLTSSLLQLPLPGTVFWGEVQADLRIAVLASFFWSATTVIYFLLRQSDDGTPLDQVYIPGPPPKSEPLPVVGVAASQQPVIERPATETAATNNAPSNPPGS